MIVWLASFPRSGNTFMRVLLHQCFGKETYSIHNDKYDIEKTKSLSDITGHTHFDENALAAMRTDDKTYFIKTHRLNISDYINDKVIYLIRDGRDATVSLAIYTKNFAPGYFSPIQIIDGEFAFGSWHEHVAAWSRKSDNIQIVKFENLVANPLRITDKLADDFGLTYINRSAPVFSELHALNGSFFNSGQSLTYLQKMNEIEHNYFWFKSHEQMLANGYTENIPAIFTDEKHSLFLKSIAYQLENSRNDQNGNKEGLKNEIATLNERQLQLKNKNAELEEQKKELEARKAREINELRTNVVALQANIDNLRKKESEQQKITADIQLRLELSQGEVGRLQTLAGADQRLIHELDEKARGLAMSMHAREAVLRASWWRRRFLPKMPLPRIEAPISLASQPISNAARPIDERAPDITLKPSASPRQAIPTPPPPASSTSATPDGKRPGSFERYPDRTGQRIAEGGRRLNGEKRASRPGEPLVTIITTVRNGEKHLAQAMESVFAQTYPNVEYIIVDGASTDGTLDLIRRYEEKVDYYVSEPDIGIYAGMNKGIELAKGDYILILNADDHYVHTAVEKLVRVAEAAEADLVAADSHNVDAEGRGVPPAAGSGLSRSSWTPLAYIVCPLKHESTLVHKNVYAHNGLYDETLKVCADWKWMAELYDGGRCRVELLGEPLLVFRKVDGASANSNAASARQHWQERIDVAAAFFPEVDIQDLPGILKLDSPKMHEEAQRLKSKYPASGKLHRILDLRRQGWRFATRVSNEDFDPLQPPFISALPTPRAEPLRSGGIRSTSRPGRWLRYPDRTGQRLAEGGRRLRSEYPFPSSDAPLVTVVTTVRNGEKHLAQAMESVFAQAYPNIEYIIVDSASTDRTLDLIRQYEEKIDYYISEPDAGIYAGMNKGIELARGDYIIVLNSDDYFDGPEAVAKLATPARDGGYEVVMGANRILDTRDGRQKILVPSLDARLFLRCTIAQEAMLVHKNVYAGFGLYDESYRVISDWCWIRKNLKRTRNLILDDSIVCFRPGGASGQDTVSTAQEKYHMLRREIPGLTWEDYYPMRYPHNLTRENALQLMDKYSHCQELRAALELFLEHDIAGGNPSAIHSVEKHATSPIVTEAEALVAPPSGKETFDPTQFNQWLADFLRKTFPPITGRARRALDVGCGTGMNAQAFQKAGWEYHGVDISDTAIEQARGRAPAGTYKLHDFSSSPLPEWENSFDCVFISTVLIHVVDDERWRTILRHAAKQLSDSGKLVIVDAVPAQRQTPAEHVVVRSLDEYKDVAESLRMTLEFHAKEQGEAACLIISKPAKMEDGAV